MKTIWLFTLPSSKLLQFKWPFNWPRLLYIHLFLFSIRLQPSVLFLGNVRILLILAMLGTSFTYIIEWNESHSSVDNKTRDVCERQKIPLVAAVVRFMREYLIQYSRLPCVPISDNTGKTRLWLILSNALLKSKYTKSGIEIDLKCLKTLSKVVSTAANTIPVGI